MRKLAVVPGAIAFAFLGCGDNADVEPPTPSPEPVSLDFGPYDVAAGEEIIDKCVQITIGNTELLNINSVELTTGVGFHHSNWFYVPESTFPGADGTYVCDDRDYNEAVAAIFGGVLFAQSTQTPHEIQGFASGVVLQIPPNSKLVAQIHLLNASEAPVTLQPNIKLTPIAASEVTTVLSGISFENQALALPPNKQSRFTVECEIGETHRMLLDRDPDFKIYYALAHYHELGTGLTVEAVRSDGTAATVFETTTLVGDTLGGMVDPAFDMTGFTKIRMSCDFFNPRAQTVRWGFGKQEMCVFLAFSDSQFNWGGGVLSEESPQNPVEVGGATHFTNPCTVFAND